MNNIQVYHWGIDIAMEGLYGHRATSDGDQHVASASSEQHDGGE